MSQQKWLYVTLDDEDATGKLAFQPSESTAALTLRALGLAEIEPHLPFAYKASVSVDGGKTFSNSDATTVSEYPKRGDVTLKIAKKPPRLYFHFFSKNVSAKNVDAKFDEPDSSECVDDIAALIAGTPSAAVATKISRELLATISEKSLKKKKKKINKTKDAIFARFSADGKCVALPATEPFAAFPLNGDIFIISDGASASSSSASASSASASSASSSVPPDELQAVFAQAGELVKKQRFGETVRLFHSVLDMLGGAAEQLSEAALPVWHQLAIVHSQGTKLHAKAIDVLRNCLKIARGMSGVEAKKQAVQYASSLAKELFHNKQYRDAANMFQEALDLCGSAVTLSTQVARELRIRMGAAMFMGGAKPQGMQIVQDALAGDTSLDIGVFWMSKFYAEMDHDDDALQWAATLLLKHNEDADYRQNFADLVFTIPDAIGILKTKIVTGGTPKHAQVWCFFGRVLQDCGMLSLAAKMYEHGLVLEPDNANYVLNYVHVLEHLNQLAKALQTLYKFLVKRGDTKVGMNKNFEPAPAEVARIIFAGAAAAAAAAAAASEGDQKATTMSWPASFPTQPLRLSKPAAGGGEYQEIRFFEDGPCAESDDSASMNTSPRESGDSTSQNDTRPKNNALFQEDDQSLVGLYFTAVKLLFTMGALAPLPALIAKINPIRQHNQWHETKMKNEQSYFMTVALAVQFLTAPAAVALRASASFADNKTIAASASCSVAAGSNESSRVNAELVDSTIFYVGDSHSISPSWHVLDLQEKGKQQQQQRLVVNRLVTGLKLWHLRPEGNFYPKKQFEAVTATLPPGSDVIFNFGEIDCREAALKVVERGLYESVEDAFAHLAEIYRDAIADIKYQRRLRRVFVLGPLPVLDVTRSLVVKCNRVLADVFSKKKSASGVVFVDVCDRVLCDAAADPAGTRHEVAVKAGEPRVLRSEFHFDRTHIHPRFVRDALGPALSEAMAV